MKNSMILTALCSFALSTLNAQQPPCDTIFTNDGRVLEVAIQKVTSDEIQYTACKSTDDAAFAIGVSSVKELRSSKFKLLKPPQNIIYIKEKKRTERNYSLTFGTNIYGDLSDGLEPLAGFDLAFDAKIKKIPNLGYLGASISYGVFDGLYGYYDSGKIFKIGPMLSVGKPKRSGTFALQYLNFKDVLLSPFTYRGLNLDAGLKLIGRHGGVFHLSFFYQRSFNKEPISQYVQDPHTLSNIGLRIAIGWAFPRA